MSDSTRCIKHRGGGGVRRCGGLMEIGAEREMGTRPGLPVIKHGWGMNGCRPDATFNARPWLTLTVSNEFYSLPSFECRLRSWGYLRGMIDWTQSDVWGWDKGGQRGAGRWRSRSHVRDFGGKSVQLSATDEYTNILIQGSFHKLIYKTETPFNTLLSI